MKKIFYALLLISMNLFAQEYNFEPAQDYEKIENTNEYTEQEYSYELQDKNKEIKLEKKEEVSRK